jgi:hypothetical protein
MPYKNGIYLKNTFYNVNLVRRDRNKVCQFLIWEMAKAKKVRLKLKKHIQRFCLAFTNPQISAKNNPTGVYTRVFSV